MSLSKAEREAKWLCNLYNKLRFGQKKPTLILGDNKGAMAMAWNPQFHKRSKHIETKYLWIREGI